MLVKMTQLKSDMEALKAREDAQDSKIAELEEKLKAFTSDVVAAGQCGEDVYYIRYADGHVLLQGSGATYDYSDESTPKSVFYNMPEIKSVIVQEGITKLGNALRQTDITEIVIPTKVSVIEDYLLSTCTKLKTVRAESSTGISKQK